MKKTIAILISAALLLPCFGAVTFADESAADAAQTVTSPEDETSPADTSDETDPYAPDSSDDDLTGDELSDDDLAGDDSIDHELSGDDSADHEWSGDDLTGDESTSDDLSGSNLMGENPAPVSALAPDAAPEEDALEIRVDGSLLVFDDAKPFIENDRTLVPIRALCVALGIANEDITFADGIVSIKGMADGKECIISLTIGSASASVNGVAQELDVAAQIINDRTFVPLRFVSETFHCQVQFYGASPVYGNRKLVEIKSPAYTRFSVFVSEEALEEGVGQLFEVAAEITGIHEINGIVGEKEETEETINNYVRLILASGEQSIILDTGYLREEVIETAVKEGTIARLEELIVKYAPDTVKKIQESEELKKLVYSEDGSIIAFPVERNGKTERVFVSAFCNTDKAVSLIHGYNEVIKSLAESKDNAAKDEK